MKKNPSQLKLIDQINFEATIEKIMEQQGWPKLISISRKNLIAKIEQEPEFILEACKFLNIEPVLKETELEIKQVRDYLAAVEVIVKRHRELAKKNTHHQLEKELFLMNFVSPIKLLETKDISLEFKEYHGDSIINYHLVNGLEILLEFWNNGALGKNYCCNLRLKLSLKINVNLLNDEKINNTDWHFPLELFQIQKTGTLAAIYHPLIKNRYLLTNNLEELAKLTNFVEKVRTALKIKTV